MTSDFYKAFEDAHRGSRELIKARLRVYLPFVEPFKTQYPQCRAFDLGCGRGEWLELLRELEIDARGVDVNEKMVEACRELGLHAEHKEAVSMLRALPDEILVVVSGIHIVEHMPFSHVEALVREAIRVLKPGGLLILETPNPENLVTATANFYIDPTHVRPVPHQLLSFLTEYYGFYRTKILRLQEVPNYKSGDKIGLIDVFEGVSPDYAILAQKAADKEVLTLFDELFDTEYGLDLRTLAERYEAHREEQVQGREALLRVIGTHINEANAERDKIQSKIAGVQADLRVLRIETERFQTRLHNRELELQAICSSTSWRITAPLRFLKDRLGWLVKGLRGLLVKIGSFPLKLASRALLRIARCAAMNPRLRSLGKKLLSRSPALRARVRRLLDAQASPQLAPATPDRATSEALSYLPESARRVYWELKEEIKRSASGRGE